MAHYHIYKHDRPYRDRLVAFHQELGLTKFSKKAEFWSLGGPHHFEFRKLAEGPLQFGPLSYHNVDRCAPVPMVELDSLPQRLRKLLDVELDAIAESEELLIQDDDTTDLSYVPRDLLSKKLRKEISREGIAYHQIPVRMSSVDSLPRKIRGKLVAHPNTEFQTIPALWNAPLALSYDSTQVIDKNKNKILALLDLVELALCVSSAIVVHSNWMLAFPGRSTALKCWRKYYQLWVDLIANRYPNARFSWAAPEQMLTSRTKMVDIHFFVE